MHNLDFFYGTNQVLFDINLEVAQGEMVALLGTNGAGKSTLLRAVSGLTPYAPGRGAALRREHAVPGARTDHRRRSRPPGGRQDDVSGLTVHDNLRIGGHTLRRDRATAAAARRGAGGLPGAGGPLDQPAGTLSGGEQQMLALCA